jgi:ketosteroid isomerase-like protein
MEREVTETSAALVAALENGDASAAGRLYTEDARLVASATEPIEGRADIEAYWDAGVRLGLSALKLERRLLETVGTGILELGRYAAHMQGEVGRTVEQGTYLVLHAKSADGLWRRAVDVFNRDEAMPTQPGATSDREPAPLERRQTQ